MFALDLLAFTLFKLSFRSERGTEKTRGGGFARPSRPDTTPTSLPQSARTCHWRQRRRKQQQWWRKRWRHSEVTCYCFRWTHNAWESADANAQTQWEAEGCTQTGRARGRSRNTWLCLFTFVTSFLLLLLLFFLGNDVATDSGWEVGSSEVVAPVWVGAWKTGENTPPFSSPSPPPLQFHSL